MCFWKIIRITQKENVNFFDVRDETGTITIVAFGNMNKISEDLEINVCGKIAIYKGELEIIANKIEVIIWFG